MIKFKDQFISDLEFDHKDPSTKFLCVTCNGRSLKAIKVEMIKCQVLCVPCHKTKTIKDKATRDKIQNSIIM